ncbi:MAG: acyl-CoA dehydrogenase [Actinobacteria bacterium]|nr:acyl-CoA dehydrogenase [Actinomycetota bacterium]
MVSHYKPNLRDIEFNLFEVHRIQDHLSHPAWAPGLDRDTVGDILTEIERLAREEFAAVYAEADRTRLELRDGSIELPAGVKKAIRAYEDGGWSRLGVSEEMGGMPVPPTVHWAIQEMLLAANTTVTFYSGGELFARVLFEEGTEEQKELAKLWVEREWAGTMMLTEPDAGSDVGSGMTKAIDQGDGTWHLEGVKRFITGGEHDAAENIIHLVLARPEGAAPGSKGLSLFVVPKYLIDENGAPGARNGVYATTLEKKMGLKGSTTCEMTFGLDQPAVGYLVGDRHDGIRQMFDVIENARMMVGTKAIATLSTGYLNALEYAKERVQGPDMAQMTDKAAPRVTIIHHPDVRLMLMKQKAWAEGLRALVFYTASQQDRVELSTHGGQVDDVAVRLNDLLLPIVKGYGSEKAYELLAMSLQVFGGSGYTEDYPIEQYLRDAKIDTIYEGTTGIQALDLFFRKIVRDQGKELARLAAEITEFVKGGADDDPIATEREKLGAVLDDAQAHLGAMVEDLMASAAGEKERIYEVGLHANGLLESMAEVVISWQLLRHAGIAAPKMEDDPFYRGRVEAARWFLDHVAPKVAARRKAAAEEDGSLMNLPVEAF